MPRLGISLVRCLAWVDVWIWICLGAVAAPAAVAVLDDNFGPEPQNNSLRRLQTTDTATDGTEAGDRGDLALCNYIPNCGDAWSPFRDVTGGRACWWKCAANCRNGPYYATKACECACQFATQTSTTTTRRPATTRTTITTHTPPPAGAVTPAPIVGTTTENFRAEGGSSDTQDTSVKDEGIPTWLLACLTAGLAFAGGIVCCILAINIWGRRRGTYGTINIIRTASDRSRAVQKIRDAPTVAGGLSPRSSLQVEPSNSPRQSLGPAADLAVATKLQGVSPRSDRSASPRIDVTEERRHRAGAALAPVTASERLIANSPRGALQDDLQASGQRRHSLDAPGANGEKRYSLGTGSPRPSPRQSPRVSSAAVAVRAEVRLAGNATSPRPDMARQASPRPSVPVLNIPGAVAKQSPRPGGSPRQ